MTTVSKDIAIDWQKLNILYPWQIMTIENGVDLSRFALNCDRHVCRQKLGIPERAIVIGTVVGYVRPVKDLKTMILAFNELLVFRNDLHLAIVGYGEHLEPLQNLVTSLGIEKYTSFLGQNNDIQQVLAAYDIYVNSSIYEGMSNTILEAMAMSKPVVATDVGGTPFIIKDEWNGIIVPSGSPDKLADAIARLIEDKKLRSRLGKNGRESVKNYHNFRHTIYAYAHLYSTAYSRTQSRRNKLDSIVKNVAFHSITPILSIRKQRVKPGLHVLATHQVVPMERWNYLLQPQQSIPLETFEKQVNFLLENARPIGSNEIADRLSHPNGFDQPFFTVTFDDGFKDVYEFAFPVMRKCDIPFFIFFVSDPLLSGKDIWWCKVVKEVHALFHQNWQGWLDFCDDNAWFFSKNGFRDNLDIFKIIKELLYQLNFQHAEFRSSFCIDLERRTKNLLLAKDMQLLSSKEVRHMLDSGLLSIGSHSVNHYYLDNLEPMELEKELGLSRESIEDKFDVKVKSFAYPWGRWNTACQEICKKMGYDIAFTTTEGGNYGNIDPYALKRRDAGYLTTNLMYSKAKTLVEMSGLLDFLHR